MKEKTKQTNFRLEVTIHDKLLQIAKEGERSLSQQIRKILKQWLKEKRNESS